MDKHPSNDRVNAGATRDGDALFAIADPERALATAHAPAAARPALAVLWALDERLGAIVAATRDPAIGAIRLAWWRDALTALDEAAAPDEPLLQAVARRLLPAGIAGQALADLTEGWEPLFDLGGGGEAALALHAEARGGQLFALAARLLGTEADEAVRQAGEGWALADLAHRMGDRAVAERARRLSLVRLRASARRRWARAERPLGMLAALAREDAATATRAQGAPGRVLRMLRVRLLGR